MFGKNFINRVGLKTSMTDELFRIELFFFGTDKIGHTHTEKRRDTQERRATHENEKRHSVPKRGTLMPRA